MGAIFITTKKTLFAVFGCSVFHYLVASAMRTFYRRRYHDNPPVFDLTAYIIMVFTLIQFFLPTTTSGTSRTKTKRIGPIGC
jgi:Na+-driven multidrug efflux pump